jgi:hypothetical protein
MNARLREMVGADLDEETFFAWGTLILLRASIEELPPPDPKEIARILRLGRQVPTFVQDWLADLIDPPPDSIGELKFVLKRNGRAVQKFETIWKEHQKGLAIMAAMERGKSVTEAIAEIMPGKARQGFRVFESTQRRLKQFASIDLDAFNRISGGWRRFLETL